MFSYACFFIDMLSVDMANVVWFNVVAPRVVCQKTTKVLLKKSETRNKSNSKVKN
jgi:hypothetical protein